MTSLPEGGRSRHDPDSLARQPARQAASSQGAAWQRLAEVAAPERARQRRASLDMPAGHPAQWPLIQPEGRAHQPGDTWSLASQVMLVSEDTRFPRSRQPGRGGLATHLWTRCHVSLWAWGQLPSSGAHTPHSRGSSAQSSTGQHWSPSPVSPGPLPPSHVGSLLACSVPFAPRALGHGGPRLLGPSSTRACLWLT